MHALKSKWDVERAAAWLRKRGWAIARPASAAAAVPAAAVMPAVAPAELPDGGAPAAPACACDDEIDIAGWPALVAPFYD